MDDAYTKFIATVDTPQGLDNERIKLLRKCDTVVFDTKKGSSEIRCIFHKDNKKRDRQWVYDIPVVSNYDHLPKYHCVTSSHHVCFDDTWKSIVSLLRKGDEIHLKWDDGGFTNDLLKKVNMGTDSLSIQIYRNGKYRFNFL